MVLLAPAPVTVIAPELLPAARPLRLAPMVSVPLFVPLAGETLSQLWLLDAVQLSVPPPLLLTVAVCEAGLPLPAVPLKLRAAVETESTGEGAGAPTVRPTVIVWEPLLAPGALTVTVAEYVPAANPFRFGCIESVPGAVPLAGETVSQLWLLDAVQLSVPPPLLLRFTVWAAGLDPPAVPVKVSPMPLIESEGAAGWPDAGTT